MTRSRETGDVGYRAYKKNLWINGNFGVVQRPQPYTATGYGPDRAFLYTPTSSSVLTDAVYGHKLNLDGSAVTQGIELDVQGIGSPMTVGKTFTISFKCLCDGATTIDVLGVFRDKVGDGTNSVFEPNANADLGVGNGLFKEFSHTFTMSVSPLASNLTFEMYIGVTGGVAQFVEVQLEEGSSATSFEYVSPQENYAACQRYYEKAQINTMGATADNTRIITTWVYKVTKHRVPDISFTPITGTLTVGTGTITPESVRIDNTVLNVQSSAVVIADAEL